MRRGAALATPAAAAARLGPEHRAGGYRYAGGREARAGQGGSGGKGRCDQCRPALSPTFPSSSLGAPPTPCHPRASPRWAHTLPLPSPTPLQIPLQHLPAGGLCVASLRTPPPCSSPSPPFSHATPISIPLPIPPRAKEREGDPSGASREWLGGRGWPVLSVSYPLSRSGSPKPGRGGTEAGARCRALVAGGRRPGG